MGISIKPSTPLSDIEPFYDQVDLILVMSVEPGFGGQEYMDGSTERILNIKQKLKEIQDFWAKKSRNLIKRCENEVF